jgi:hypothetical protein
MPELLTEFTAAETVQVLHLIPFCCGNRIVTTNQCGVKVMIICAMKKVCNTENCSIFKKTILDG